MERRSGTTMTVGLSVWVALAMAVGCEASNRTVSEGGDADSDTDSDTDGDGDGDGDGDTDTTEPPEDGCESVDLLFVIDNSGSMKQYQDALAAQFPGFVDAIYEYLPSGVDIHVGVTTTSFSDDVGNSCDLGCLWYQDGTCAGGSGCLRNACYEDYGATGNGYQGRLYEHDGVRFFATNTSAGEQEQLKTWFTEVAEAVGEQGNGYEFSIAAAARVMEPMNAELNAGFLRDEGAVLFLFFLTDQWDESIEELATYIATVDAAKAGCNATIEEGNCIVPAALMNPCTVPDAFGGNASGGFGDWAEGGHGPDGLEGDLLWNFLLNYAATPVWGDITQPATYSGVVGEGLATVITQTCAEIVVPE